MSEPMYQWVIYDHPKDYPEHFVAKKWQIEEIKYNWPRVNVRSLIVTKELEDIRQFFRDKGMFFIPRQPDDDPVIIERWLLK